MRSIVGKYAIYGSQGVVIAKETVNLLEEVEVRSQPWKRGHERHRSTDTSLRPPGSNQSANSRQSKSSRLRPGCKAPKGTSNIDGIDQAPVVATHVVTFHGLTAVVESNYCNKGAEIYRANGNNHDSFYEAESNGCLALVPSLLQLTTKSIIGKPKGG
ncbi:MAG: hypothetical protein M0T78_01820 [Actinomycetota bacterium]|nr:hypothetical protein [Actinomycetota bacterium]